MSRLIWNHLSIVGSESDIGAIEKSIDPDRGLLESLSPEFPETEPEIKWGCRDRVFEYFGDIKSSGINFDTYRGPPLQAVINFSKKFPDVVFQLGWICEDEMLGGMCEIRNGTHKEAEFESEQQMRDYASYHGYYFDDDDI